MKRIYLDFAATTPVRPEAVAAMLALLGNVASNPSSVHAEGRAARAVLDAARLTVARALGAKPREIVFTAGGSESIGLAIIGTARAAAERGRHVVTSVAEHRAVLQAVDVLERDGWRVTRLAVDSAGLVHQDEFAAALQPDTVLASIMLANNELGSIAPVTALAATARRAGVLFHTDAVQAPGLLELCVDALGVDLLSISAHKFYGPNGAGALYVRSGTPIAPQIVGGNQEFGLRAGTENVAAIAGLAAALELACAECGANAARLAGLRDRLEAGIAAAVPDARFNAAGAARLSNVSSVAFADVLSAALLIRLDLEGIAASAGSACAAGSLEPSHVAEALGLPDEYRRGVLRFSLGHSTTGGEVERVIAILPQVVAEVRGVAGIV